MYNFFSSFFKSKNLEPQNFFDDKLKEKIEDLILNWIFLKIISLRFIQYLQAFLNIIKKKLKFFLKNTWLFKKFKTNNNSKDDESESKSV